jgi:GNAT superfamily N-acetyltransferase
MDDAGVVVRAMAAGDSDAVAAAHIASFPGFFLTFLGPGFLRLLYRGIVDDPGGVAIVAERDARILGFVAGVTEQSGFYRRLIVSRKWAFARAALGGVCSRPWVVPRLLRALRKPADSRESVANACLMSIAVLPSEGGRGLGRRLVAEFSKEMRRRGVAAFGLTTDRDGNASVNEFYVRAGFELRRTFVTPEGRAMNEYFFRVDP